MVYYDYDADKFDYCDEAVPEDFYEDNVFYSPYDIRHWITEEEEEDANR